MAHACRCACVRCGIECVAVCLCVVYHNSHGLVRFFEFRPSSNVITGRGSRGLRGGYSQFKSRLGDVPQPRVGYI
eukprot:679552-Prymnesium_polylepis.1